MNINNVRIIWDTTGDTDGYLIDFGCGVTAPAPHVYHTPQCATEEQKREMIEETARWDVIDLSDDFEFTEQDPSSGRIIG